MAELFATSSETRKIYESLPFVCSVYQAHITCQGQRGITSTLKHNFIAAKWTLNRHIQKRVNLE